MAGRLSKAEHIEGSSGTESLKCNQVGDSGMPRYRQLEVIEVNSVTNKGGTTAIRPF